MPNFFLGVIIKSVIDANNEHQNKNQLSMISLSDNTLVLQYKDVIREQDMQIQKLNQANDSLTKEKQELEVLYILYKRIYIHVFKNKFMKNIFQINLNIIMQAQAQELRSTISHLRDQNLVLRAAQINIGNEKEKTIVSSNNPDLEKELQMYKTMIADLENRLAEYAHIATRDCKEKNSESELEHQLKSKIEELEKLKKDQEDLLELLTDQDNKIMLYKERLIELGNKVHFMELHRII